MYNNNTFNQENVPKALSKEEVKECFVRYRNGDLKARNQVIEHNIRLVMYRINTRFANFSFDPEEMCAYGLIGLIKSVDTFDLDKNINFASYAIRCIDNEILMYVRKESKHTCTTNLEAILTIDVDGNEMKYEDVLEDQNITFVEDYEDQEEYKILLNLTQRLSEDDKKIFFSSIGICGYKKQTQKEVADELGISQSYVSRRLQMIIKMISDLYEKYCEKHSNQNQIEYQHETIQKRKPIKRREKQKVKREVNETSLSKIESKDELDVSKMLDDPKFRDIINLLDEKARLIVLLNLGSGFERSFAVEEIAQFLGIETAVVTSITKNVFIEYKNCLTKEKEDPISKVQKINKKVNLEV